MFRLFKFILPLILWIFVHRDFVFGSIPLNMDTNTIYGVTKFYFNNLLNGVVPLWDPFVALGKPFYALAICNLFNPVTQIILLLKVLGLNYHLAFNVYMVLYFFLGALGFYCLAKRILADRTLAYLAYLCFMFSSLGTSMFTQLTFLEILVPTIWFFYFLLSFAKSFKLADFLGLTLSLMITLGAYLPFYFVTVLSIFIVLQVLVYPKITWQYLKASAQFKCRHPWLTLVCGIGVIIAALPLLSYKMLDATGDVVSPGRHCQYATAQECYDRTMSNQGGMLYSEIAKSGGLGERLDMGYLFGHLDKITYGSDSLFFVPILVFVLLILSVILKADRLNVVLLGLMTGIGLIALGDATPVHKFLFDHVFFFAYFRNLFFLGAFLIPIGIIFAFKQMQALLLIKPESISHKKGMIAVVLMAHGVLLFVLSRFQGIMVVSWISVGISAVLFSIYYVGGYRWRINIWLGLFGVLLLIQPIAVIAAYAQNAAEFKSVLPSDHVRPEFQWVRPALPAVSNSKIYQFVPYEDFWYAMSMQDAPANVGYPQSVARWTFALAQSIGEERLKSYAQKKFYIYDRQGSADMLSLDGIGITGSSYNLKVLSFDVNQITTIVHFDQKYFLVYNDSYTRAWHANIDGVKTEVFRANGAFKGIWIPAGQHTVKFAYEPPGGAWPYILSTITLFVFLMWTLLMLYWRR